MIHSFIGREDCLPSSSSETTWWQRSTQVCPWGHLCRISLVQLFLSEASSSVALVTASLKRRRAGQRVGRSTHPGLENHRSRALGSNGWSLTWRAQGRDPPPRAGTGAPFLASRNVPFLKGVPPPLVPTKLEGAIPCENPFQEPTTPELDDEDGNGNPEDTDMLSLLFRLVRLPLTSLRRVNRLAWQLERDRAPSTTADALANEPAGWVPQFTMAPFGTVTINDYGCLLSARLIVVINQQQWLTMITVNIMTVIIGQPLTAMIAQDQGFVMITMIHDYESS